MYFYSNGKGMIAYVLNKIPSYCNPGNGDFNGSFNGFFLVDEVWWPWLLPYSP